MDAFTQSVESFLSRYGTWLTRTVALESAVMVRSALPQMFERFEPGAAERLLYGSYLAGIALSNARLGLVHGLAHPLGARCGVPHGLACAVCLPPVLDFNRPAAPDLFRELGGALGGDPAEVARGLLARLRLASPFSGREPPDLPGIVEETMASGSTAANARDVSAADVERIVRGLFAAAA
jgi:alcohol dehydrogenase class IV